MDGCYVLFPTLENMQSDNSDSNYRKQVHNVMNTLFHGLYENKLNFNPDLLWTGYTDFDNMNGPFYGA